MALGGPAQADGRQLEMMAVIATAELWLVRSAQGLADEVMPTQTRAMMTGGDYAFPPVRIQTASGVFTVRITGSVQVGIDPQGQRKLAFVAVRRLGYLSNTRAPRDAEPDFIEGTTRTVVDLPAPSEVLQFDMPPLRVPAGAPAVADHFSIRVRLTPFSPQQGR